MTPAGKPSSTQKLLDQLLEAIKQYDVATSSARVVDFDIKPGVRADEGDGDDWPEIRRRMLAARILVMATPIWMGHRQPGATGAGTDGRVPGRDRRGRPLPDVRARGRRRVLPDLKLTPTFAWGGTFAETEDGLPFFGPHAQYGPRVHFAMAYGGNGITYSMLGARLIRALLERRRHRLLPLFSFVRLARAQTG